ncbi:MAG: Wzz/FepE/Etk N-terminal domain-containing protein, partial [Nitrospiria bacterium]
MPTIAEEPATTDAEDIDLFEYLQAVWSHRRLILLGTLGAMAAAGALSLALPKTYQASMLLKVGTLFVPGEGGGPSLIESPKTVVQVLSGDATALKLR